jgi:asparagine synthase (glutamine-hydrolysing)
MQFRYLIAVPHEARPLTALRGKLAASYPGYVRSLPREIVIWSNKSYPNSLEEYASNLHITGDIHPNKGKATFSNGWARTPCATTLEDLVTRFWGAYVAVEAGGSNNRTRVFRAPMGALPAYYTICNGCIVVASDVALLHNLGLVRGGIDWWQLTAFLGSSRTLTQRTCLTGIHELPPGCVLEIGPGPEVAVNSLWKFWDHVQSANRPSRRSAEASIREAIGNSISAMLQNAGEVGISLSGGLDSSIVASCAAFGGRQPILLTFATSDPDGDEREFAKAVADKLGLELLEYAFEERHVDFSRSASQHLPRPTGHAHAQSVAKRYIEVARQLGLDAIMNGMGGDNVFCTNSSTLPLVDAILARAPFADVRDTFSSLRYLTQASASDIVFQIAQIIAGRRRPNWVPGLAHFLIRELGEASVDPLKTRWLGDGQRSLPGKAYHVEMIVRALHTVEGFDRETAPIWLSPLMSQPVVEACLAIPTWMWTSGGMNRAVARMAFSHHLPPSVVHRRTKGGPDAFSRDVALARRGELREIVLEGELARRGILDRRRLEGAFEDGSMLRDGYHAQLLHIADIEAWISYWSGLASPAEEGLFTL